jgi:hypothetical protein
LVQRLVDGASEFSGGSREDDATVVALLGK